MPMDCARHIWIEGPVYLLEVQAVEAPGDAERDRDVVRWLLDVPNRKPGIDCEAHHRQGEWEGKLESIKVGELNAFCFPFR